MARVRGQVLARECDSVTEPQMTVTLLCFICVSSAVPRANAFCLRPLSLRMQFLQAASSSGKESSLSGWRHIKECVP